MKGEMPEEKSSESFLESHAFMQKFGVKMRRADLRNIARRLSGVFERLALKLEDVVRTKSLCSSGKRLSHDSKWLGRVTKRLEKLLALLEQFLNMVAAPCHAVNFGIGHFPLGLIFAG